MDKVVSISLWKFVLGAVATIAVPTIVYCFIGGPVPPLLFVVIVLAGVNVGLINYIHRD